MASYNFDEHEFKKAVFTKTAMPSSLLDDPRKPVRYDIKRNVMGILDAAYDTFVAAARAKYDAYASRYNQPLTSEEKEEMLARQRLADPFPTLGSKPPVLERPPLCSWETYLAESIRQTKQELKVCDHHRRADRLHVCSVGEHTAVIVWQEDRMGVKTPLMTQHRPVGRHWRGVWPMWQVELLVAEEIYEQKMDMLMSTGDFS